MTRLGIEKEVGHCHFFSVWLARVLRTSHPSPASSVVAEVVGRSDCHSSYLALRKPFTQVRGRQRVAVALGGACVSA